MAGPELQPLLGRPSGRKSKPSTAGLIEALLLM